MSELGPKKSSDLDVSTQGPSTDFRSDPDISVSIDRKEFAQNLAAVSEKEVEAGQSIGRSFSMNEELDPEMALGLEAVLQTLQLPRSEAALRNEQIRTFEVEQERERSHAQMVVADELFERVQVVMQHLDAEMQDVAEVGIIAQLKGAIKNVMACVGPVLTHSTQLSPAEAERVILATGTLRRLVKEVLLQLEHSKLLSKSCRDIFKSLDDLLEQSAESVLYPAKEKRQKGSRKEPLVVRIFKGVVGALRRFLFGGEPSEEAEEQQRASFTREDESEMERVEPHVPVKSRRMGDEAHIAAAGVLAHVLKGRVIDLNSQQGIPGVVLFAGALGSRKTDEQGLFEFIDVPHGYEYILGAFKKGYSFAPPLITGTMLDSEDFEFLGVLDEAAEANTP